MGLEDADLALALLIAGATALGGVVAAVVTWLIEGQRQKFSRGVEARRERREQAREDAAARGAARVLSGDLFRAHVAFSTSTTNRTWWPDNIDLTWRVNADDRKLVSSRLPPDDWVKVLKAEALVEVRVSQRAWQPPGAPTLADRERKQLEETLPEIREAQVALGKSESGVAITPPEPPSLASPD